MCLACNGIAPIITTAAPTAAIGVSTGAIPVAAGRIRPIAASRSTTPMSTETRGESNGSRPPGRAAGALSFIRPEATNTAATRPCTIQSTTFTEASQVTLHLKYRAAC